nr:hypothetical protein [Tanacetum cinerariifolium]
MMTPFYDDPNMLVRQAYTPIATNIESEPLEDPIKTKETKLLSQRTTPLSRDYTPAFVDYTPDTPHSNEESEPIEASDTRTASRSHSTSPLSPDHPLTHTSPTPTPSKAFYYRSTARLAVRTQSTLSPNISAKVTEAMDLSPSSFYKRYISSYETPSLPPSPVSSPPLPIQKRYQGTSKPILDTETKDNESEAEGAGLGSEDSKDEGPGSDGEEAASEEQQQQQQSFNIEINAPPVHAPVQPSASPEWSSGSLPISPASLTIPSHVASLVTTPAATIAVDWDKFIEVGAQLELHQSILYDHTQFLDALPPTLLEGWAVNEPEEHEQSLVHHAADQHEIQGLRERVAAFERRMSRFEK